MPKPGPGTRKGKLLRSLSLVLVLVWIGIPAYAQFVSSVIVSSSNFTTATLMPPTELTGSAYCDGDSVRVALTWSATSSTFADGYDVYQATASGGPYSKIVHVNGLTTTSYTTQGMTPGLTYFYVAGSTANSWTSTHSDQTPVGTPETCP